MDLIKEGLGIFVQPTGVSRKLVIDGKAKTYPVYRVRLDMLYYNDQNDRIATWLSQYNSDHPDEKLDPSNREAYNAQLESFIVASNPEAITRTQNNIELVDQREPAVVLIDGGIKHAGVAVSALQELGLEFPVFGMVKDDRHRTRALVTPQGQEIRIDNNQAIFSLIGNIQEETHRFAITYHRHLRSKRLRYSELDGIAGIGPKRKQELLKQFKSLTAIGGASLQELERILPKDAAAAVYHHFHKNEEEQ